MRRSARTSSRYCHSLPRSAAKKAGERRRALPNIERTNDHSVRVSAVTWPNPASSNIFTNSDSLNQPKSTGE